MLALKWEASKNPANRAADGAMNDTMITSDMLQEFEQVLANQQIRPVFQPIVSLDDGTVAGYEALSRGPQNSPLESPALLFSAAEQSGKVWDLDFLCRTKALEKAKHLPDMQMLFINVDPKIINDARFEKGVTKEILDSYQIDATKIIFEITEKTSINDYKSFRRVLDNYTSQGYKIAIDDTGSGYSGLKMLAETRPQFVKIDMDLVRDIDKDSLKQALMRAFQDFAVLTNMKIIAEGIETVDELNTLISLGIPYGQGFFLGRPEAEFMDILPAIRQHVIAKQEQKQQELFHTPLTIPIGDIARRDPSFEVSTIGSQAIEHFDCNPNLMGITIVQDGYPVGLLMRNTLFGRLGTQYGVAVYTKRQVSLLMDRNPLIVDYYMPLDQVSKFAVSRPEKNLYDYIIVTRNGLYYGITTVKCLLEKTTQLEVNRAKHCNPLSGLPGNILIEEKLRQELERRTDFAVLYFDLDNFKAYNDTYGFDNGDKVLSMLAQMIQQQVLLWGNRDCFVGHIGGDDFIAVVKQVNVEALCQALIELFDNRILDFYTERDKIKGYIIAKNRHGVEEKYPLISLSIAVVKNQAGRFKSTAALAETAGGVKKRCKVIWKSCYFVGPEACGH